MSATAFIRRRAACDILVSFNNPYYPNHLRAWRFCQRWLRMASNNRFPEADLNYDEREFWRDQTVASTPVGTAICYCMHDGFPEAPYSETSQVNPRGTVSLTQQEALLLGPEGEPENFVPYASEDILSYDRPPMDDSDTEDGQVPVPSSDTQGNLPSDTQETMPYEAQQTPPTVQHLQDISGVNIEEDDHESLYGSEADAAEQREYDLLYREYDEEPCTFGRERGICRCCGELTVEPEGDE
jgi:hypothetical protein